ncbi:hydroxyethylthiazole kinase [Zongyangia hominis]|uniref:Hydroxyethylthiazole kinase n=1 Tax=Zongyangia hominis TaxID=2763677 RepID=A0A926EFQ5_9FIRM|nr:hydroxyethylthiazole kinase [Zongyangia hominis]MBC8570852.1 hydroxyethylthiazole kinase [Zongyangia hominis]
MLEGIIEAVRQNRPLVHCITNFVTANDCANALLAVGASPIMADAPEEAAEIAGRCDALVLNLGTPSAGRLTAMELAGKRVNEAGRPVVFDPVGVSASAFRREGARKLMEGVRFSAVRGNISEISFLAGHPAGFGGVDAGEKDAAADLAGRRRLAASFARTIRAVVVITGETDVVSDGEKIFCIRNGHAMMSRVTGTGCILSALIGAFLTVDAVRPVEAVAAAVGAFGVCGERAYEKAAQAGRGTGSYHLALLDELSLLREDSMGGIRIENC